MTKIIRNLKDKKKISYNLLNKERNKINKSIWHVKERSNKNNSKNYHAI